MRQFAVLLVPVIVSLAAPLAAQPLSPHEKLSEIYKLIKLCPNLKVDRKALNRYAMLNGIDLTPGSREERWYIKRATYDLRKLPQRYNSYLCKEGITRYGPQGGIAPGIMLTN